MDMILSRTFANDVQSADKHWQLAWEAYRELDRVSDAVKRASVGASIDAIEARTVRMFRDQWPTVCPYITSTYFLSLRHFATSRGLVDPRRTAPRIRLALTDYERRELMDWLDQYHAEEDASNAEAMKTLGVEADRIFDRLWDGCWESGHFDRLWKPGKPRPLVAWHLEESLRATTV